MQTDLSRASMTFTFFVFIDANSIQIIFMLNICKSHRLFTPKRCVRFATRLLNSFELCKTRFSIHTHKILKWIFNVYSNSIDILLYIFAKKMVMTQRLNRYTW